MKYIAIVSIIVSLCLLFLVIYNTNKNNKIIKYGFVVFGLIMVLSIVINDLTIVDSIIYEVLCYIYYPSYISYNLTIILAFILFLYNLLNDKNGFKYQVINYIFAFSLIISYIIFLCLKIDIASYKELYSGLSLICLRYGSRTFSIWILVLLFIKYCQFSIKRGDKDDV